MRFFLDQTMEEIANNLGISVSTAEKLYRDFKKKYAQRFKELL
jgi:DNA-directed RNA polymerase specialized sigma24 family protein